MKASKRDRISSEPKKKRGFFSRLIRGTVKLFVIIIGLSVVVGSFIESPDRPKKTVVAAEKNQAPIPKAKPVMVASVKPAKKKKAVTTISDNDIKCYAVFSLIRDIHFSTEWSSIPNGSLITESVYRTITDMQNNMDIAIGQSSEHKKARRKSYDYKKTLTATPNKTADAAIKCMTLAKTAPAVKNNQKANIDAAIAALNTEPTIKDVLYSNKQAIKWHIGVIDDGTPRWGYAGYVCEVLREHNAVENNTWVRMVDIVKVSNGANFRTASLGRIDCNTYRHERT